MDVGNTRSQEGHLQMDSGQAGTVHPQAPPGAPCSPLGDTGNLLASWPMTSQFLLQVSSPRGKMGDGASRATAGPLPSTCMHPVNKHSSIPALPYTILFKA